MPKINKIFVGTKQVRPPIYTPGANTIAYYPLTSSSTVNDMSGNNNTLTNMNSVTFGTYAGVNCASLNAHNKCLYSTTMSIPNGKKPMTVSFYVYINGSTGRAYQSLFSIGAINHHTFTTTKYNPLTLTDYGGDAISDLSISTGGRHHICCTAESGTSNWNIYIDGVKGTITTSGSFNYDGISGSDFQINGFFWERNQSTPYGCNCYMSEFIFENKERTSQEIQDYYNGTKSLYGIS